MDLYLTGKRALISGSSSGLGAECARRLAQEGCKVVVHGRDRDRAEQTAEDIRKAGGEAAVTTGDLEKDEDANKVCEDALAAFGGIDILVNNAGLLIRADNPDWTTVPTSDWLRSFNINVVAAVRLAQKLVPGMIERGWGRVIGINTECAMQTFEHQSAYVSGKRGMDGVLRVLAREVGRHQVTVNQVAPGWMVSDKFRAAGTERQPDYEREVPMRRRGYDQDVANAVAFLASDLAAFITGVYLPVCGGNVMPAI